MRFLKNKIREVEEYRKKLLNEATFNEEENQPLPKKLKTTKKNNSHKDEIAPSPTSPKTRRRRFAQEIPKNLAPSPRNPTKNIIINYGKAISSFALSHLAVPYLKTYLENEGVLMKGFIDFVGEAKEEIGGIQSFRNLLLIKPADSTLMIKYKKIFKLISEVFIKYFSVNWIMNGKVTHKLVYLKYRFKVLRRIQNPESFTYIRKRTEKIV